MKAVVALTLGFCLASASVAMAEGRTRWGFIVTSSINGEVHGYDTEAECDRGRRTFLQNNPSQTATSCYSYTLN